MSNFNDNVTALTTENYTIAGIIGMHVPNLEQISNDIVSDETYTSKTDSNIVDIPDRFTTENVYEQKNTDNGDLITTANSTSGLFGIYNPEGEDEDKNDKFTTETVALETNGDHFEVITYNGSTIGNQTDNNVTKIIESIENFTTQITLVETSSTNLDENITEVTTDNLTTAVVGSIIGVYIPHQEGAEQIHNRASTNVNEEDIVQVTTESVHYEESSMHDSITYGELSTLSTAETIENTNIELSTQISSYEETSSGLISTTTEVAIEGTTFVAWLIEWCNNYVYYDGDNYEDVTMVEGPEVTTATNIYATSSNDFKFTSELDTTTEISKDITTDNSVVAEQATTFGDWLLDFCKNYVYYDYNYQNGDVLENDKLSYTSKTVSDNPSTTLKMVVRLRGSENEVLKGKQFSERDWPQPVYVPSAVGRNVGGVRILSVLYLFHMIFLKL